MGKKDGRPLADWRPLKGKPAGRGYLQITIRHNGKTLYRYIHQLVLAVFVGPRPSPEHEARHLDGNLLNNAVGNLRWGTKQDNAADKRLHGTDPVGERNAMAKLSDKDVACVREMLASGMPPRMIAFAAGVSTPHVRDIARGRRRSSGR
jgi:hypothetical protein